MENSPSKKIVTDIWKFLNANFKVTFNDGIIIIGTEGLKKLRYDFNLGGLVRVIVENFPEVTKNTLIPSPYEISLSWVKHQIRNPKQ
jgi:hypothetical protein